MKKLEKLEMIFKNLLFKKGIGIKIEKVCKQVRDQMVWKHIKNTARGVIEWK